MHDGGGVVVGGVTFGVVVDGKFDVVVDDDVVAVFDVMMWLFEVQYVISLTLTLLYSLCRCRCRREHPSSNNNNYILQSSSLHCSPNLF